MSTTRMNIGFLLTAARTARPAPPPLPALPSLPLSLPAHPPTSHSPVSIHAFNAEEALHSQILASKAAKPPAQQPPSIQPTHSADYYQRLQGPSITLSTPPASAPQLSPVSSLPSPHLNRKDEPRSPFAPPAASAGQAGVKRPHPDGADDGEPRKRYRCTEAGCTSQFGQKGSLTRHLKSRHEKRRPHGCAQCGKSFSEKWTLNVHLRNVHEKRKPHQCAQCRKCFGERWNLRKHVNVVHRNIKPYSCPICSRSFGYKGDMRKHVMELHVQEGRPYKCDVPNCGVKFARMRYLRRHQNLSHRPPAGDSPSPPATPAAATLTTLHAGAHSPGAVVSRAAAGGRPPGASPASPSTDSLSSMSAPARSYSALETLSMYALSMGRAESHEAPE